MVDEEQQNDEYQFSDMDVLNPEVMSEEAMESHDAPAAYDNSARKNIIRNAVIAVTVVVALMLIYKFFSSSDTTKSQPAVQQTQKTVVPNIEQPQPVVQVSEVTPVPVEQPSQALVEKAEQKIAALELSQQNLRVEIVSLNNQVDSLNGNLDTLTSKLTQLTQTLNDLNNKIDDQSREIAVIAARTRPKKVTTTKATLPPKPALVFYVKAIIPGRAWLIASNGSTITVREGSSVPGYGMVKMIDAEQGRVITSSGKIIRFSQLDS